MNSRDIKTKKNLSSPYKTREREKNPIVKVIFDIFK